MLLLAGALAGILLSPPSPDATREAAKRILESSEYQREMPKPRDFETTWGTQGGGRTSGRPGEDDGQGPRRGDRPGTRWRGPRAGGNAPEDTPADRRAVPAPSDTVRGEGSAVGQAMMWAVIAVLAILGAVWVVRTFRRVERDVKPPAEVAAPPADPSIVLRPLTEAELLARDGKFGEAIHSLLLQTLAALVARAPVAVPRSMTTREILGRVALPGESKAALSTLADASEVCWFGGRPAVSADYERCADHFRRFAAAYASGTK